MYCFFCHGYIKNQGLRNYICCGTIFLTDALSPFTITEINEMSDLDFMAVFLERITRTLDSKIDGYKFGK